MNIGIICEKLNVGRHGGSNFSIHRLATQLSERGHKVDVITLNFEHSNDPPEDRLYSVVEQSVDSYTEIDGVWNVLRSLDQIAEKQDILHVYVPGIQPLFGWWRLRNGDTPVVGHLNAYTPFCSNSAVMADGCWKNCTLYKKIAHSDSKGARLLEQVPKYVFNNTATMPLMNELDGFIALSPALDDIYNEVGLSNELTQVIPNMYDPTFKNETKMNEFSKKEDELRICYVGRVDPQKGVDTLINAILRIDDLTSFHVDIVGEDILNKGTGINELRTRVKENNMGGKVTFHGWINYESLPQFYAQTDVFVHPGRWPEPFGRTLLEALQHDCAIIASEVGAPPWIAGEAGLTFPRDDISRLEKQLRRVIQTPELVEKLQSNAKVELERFNPSEITDQIERLYEQTVRND